MNIFGIGATELVIILLIMLMVAGPKRMIRWAYVMGVYMGKLRQMWQEASDVLKKEMAEAGIEPEVVDTLSKVANPRARKAIVSSELDKLVGDMKKPIQETLRPVQEAANEVGATPLAAASAPALASPPPDTDSESPEAADNTEDSESSAAPAASDSDTTGRYEAWTPN